MKCIDSPGVIININFINIPPIVSYHINKKLDKPIAISKELIDLNKKIKKVKKFNKDIIGIRKFNL